MLGTDEARARNGAAGAVEEDARLTALFLWTLQATEGEGLKDAADEEEDEDAADDDEDGGSGSKAKGFTLVFDVVRRFAQPLGIELPKWEGRVIEIKKGVVHMLSIAERAKQLFGEDGARAGVPILDPIAALVVAGFMGRAALEIGATTTRILSDQVAMPADAISRVVMSVEQVVGCHQIRTRGSADHVFVDLHVWFPRDMSLTEAHDLSHVVKDRLMAHYPQIADAVIHIEPPPKA